MKSHQEEQQLYDSMNQAFWEQIETGFQGLVITDYREIQNQVQEDTLGLAFASLSMSFIRMVSIERK